MINNSSSSSQAGTGAGGSSGSASAGATTTTTTSSSSAATGASAGRVQFRMTVKLDIEGHVPSAPSASASGGTSSTTVDAGSAAAQSTQDLLLKLQPLLPHLCISKESAAMLQRTVSAGACNVERQLGQVREQIEAPAPTTTCDESGLELSLGLSMFKKSGTVNSTDTSSPTDTCNINTVSSCHQPDNSSPMCWSSRGGGRGEVFQEIERKKQQQQQQQQQQEQQVLQRQPSNAAGGMVRSDSMALDWRVMEEQRLKREAQYQRRQEARKKRRILIDEQKQQRKAAAAAARGGNSSSPTPLIKQPSRSMSTMLGSDVNVTPDEQQQQQQLELDGSRDEKVMTTDESRSKPGVCDSRSSYAKARKRAKQAPPDSSTVTSSLGGKVKSEVEDPPVTSSGAGVIRPSPVHEPNQEWVQKFLEMQSMVPKAAMSEEHDEQQQQQEQVDGEEESISHRRKQLKRMGSLPGMTRQGSFNLKRISSPPPVPPYRDTGMDSQCSSVCSSMPLAAGLFSVPSTYSTLTVPCKGQVAQVGKTRSVDPVGAPSSALLRSASLGTFQSSNEQQQQKHQHLQQQRSIQMPSPLRSSNSNALLLRTLSEGAALRALARGVEQPADEKVASWPVSSSSLVNRNSKSSAFKSPKKEQQQQQQPVGEAHHQPSSATSGCSTGDEAELPLVSTRGTGPNGRLVNGVLLAYRKGDVKIVCACHGQHMTAKEFVEHAGGVDVANPEKCIVVSPSKRSRLDSLR